jgi:hypothetical protein
MKLHEKLHELVGQTIAFRGLSCLAKAPLLVYPTSSQGLHRVGD